MMRSCSLFRVALLGIVILLVSLMAVPLWRAFDRNLLALNAFKGIRLIQDMGDCPELVLATESANPLGYEPEDAPRQNFFAGVTALAADQPQTAYQLLGRAVETNSPSWGEYYWLGCAALRNDELDAAVQHWRAAGAAPYFITHASYAFKIRDYATALRLYERAAGVTPDSIQAWLGITASLQNLASTRAARWEEMLVAAEHAIALAPNEPQAHYFVGYALWLLKRDLPRAEQELRWALGKRTYWGDAYSLGRLLLDRGQAGEPTLLLERALELNDLPQIRGQLVRAYLAEGRCAEASEAHRRAVDDYPHLRAELEGYCLQNKTCPCG